MTMPIENDHLPADKQDIDRIVDDIDDITEIDNLSLDELGDLYERIEQRTEDIVAMGVEIKKAIYDKQTTSSAECGPYLSLKSETQVFPELTIERAEELGLTEEIPVKQKINLQLARKAHANGVDLGKVEWKTGHIMRKQKQEEEV